MIYKATIYLDESDGQMHRGPVVREAASPEEFQTLIRGNYPPEVEVSFGPIGSAEPIRFGQGRSRPSTTSQPEAQA